MEGLSSIFSQVRKNMKTWLVLIFLFQIGFSFDFLNELDFQVDNVQDSFGLGGTGPGQETADNEMVDCHQGEEGNAENKMKLVVRLKRMAECGRRT